MHHITYHRKIKTDLKKIGEQDTWRIRRAIETKLQIDPVRFGKPLHHSLSGLRVLRVGDYRIVFHIAEAELLVVLIAHRSAAYTLAAKRKDG